MRASSLLLSLIGIAAVSCVYYGGGRSDEYYGGGKYNDGGGGGRHRPPSRPRPPPPRPRPPPPRPPPAPKQCPAQWLTFDRPQGRWCIGVFYGLMNQYSAQSSCAQHGATLTGFQNSAERMAVANEGRRILQSYGLGDAAIWLGAIRKPSCPTVGICAPTETFQWTDGHTTGTAGMGFTTGQPDGQTRNGWGVQSCLHQFIFPWSDTSPSTWPGIHHGTLDDQFCQELGGPNIKLHACGKRP